MRDISIPFNWLSNQWSSHVGPLDQPHGDPCLQAFGLSETLGAFVGGVLVAETDYKHQIEANGKRGFSHGGPMGLAARHKSKIPEGCIQPVP